MLILIIFHVHISNDIRQRFLVFLYEGAEYVTPMELKKDGAYEFVALGHSCRECGKPMKPISASDLDRLVRKNCYEPCRTGIPCPECGKPLWIENLIMWD